MSERVAIWPSPESKEIRLQPYIPADFVTVPAYFANRTTLWVGTITIAIGTAALLAWAFYDWRKDRSPAFPWMLAGAVICPFFAEPILDINMGLYLPKEAPLEMFSVFGRPMPIGDLFLWIAGACSTWIMCRMIVSGRSLSFMWTVAGLFALAELLFADFLLVRGNGILYYNNPLALFGQPVYIPLIYVSLFITWAVGLAMAIPHLRGARWLWMLVFMPGVCIAQCMVVATPSVIAIHNDYPHPIKVGLCILTGFLAIALSRVALNMPQIAQYREKAREAALAAAHA